MFGVRTIFAKISRNFVSYCLNQPFFYNFAKTKTAIFVSIFVIGHMCKNSFWNLSAVTYGRLSFLEQSVLFTYAFPPPGFGAWCLTLRQRMFMMYTVEDNQKSQVSHEIIRHRCSCVICQATLLIAVIKGIVQRAGSDPHPVTDL
jgi:hypothetical protein